MQSNIKLNPTTLPSLMLEWWEPIAWHCNCRRTTIMALEIALSRWMTTWTQPQSEALLLHPTLLLSCPINMAKFVLLLQQWQSVMCVNRAWGGLNTNSSWPLNITNCMRCKHSCRFFHPFKLPWFPRSWGSSVKWREMASFFSTNLRFRFQWSRLTCPHSWREKN